MKFLDHRAAFRFQVDQLVVQEVLAEKGILIVVASLVVHCCVIRKNVIVASQLHHVADVQHSSQ